MTDMTDMTDRHTVRILFMDDEPNSDIVYNAAAKLRDAGYIVDFVEDMDAAIEAYYERYYAVFILDIDMSHQAVDVDGDGVRVLQRFISLHNQTRVILFSGAGTVQHWFQAANAHCYAYVHKLDHDPATNANSIDRLLAKVNEAVSIPHRAMPISIKTAPQRLLLAGKDEDLKAKSMDVIKTTLGMDWHVDQMSLSEAAEAELSTYGILLIVQREFSTRSSTRNALDKLLAVAPVPQTIVCGEGRDELRGSILEIANRHPFRMIDLTQVQWVAHLQTALRDAEQWYDKPEIVQADAQALSRVHLVLPEDLPELMLRDEDILDDYPLDEDDKEEMIAGNKADH